MSKRHTKSPKTSKTSKTRKHGIAVVDARPAGGADRVRVQLSLSNTLWSACGERAKQLGYPHTPTSVIVNLIDRAIARDFAET